MNCNGSYRYCKVVITDHNHGSCHLFVLRHPERTLDILFIHGDIINDWMGGWMDE